MIDQQDVDNILASLETTYAAFVRSDWPQTAAVQLGKRAGLNDEQITDLTDGIMLYLLLVYTEQDLTAYITNVCGLASQQSGSLVHALTTSLPEGFTTTHQAAYIVINNPPTQNTPPRATPVPPPPAKTTPPTPTPPVPPPPAANKPKPVSSTPPVPKPVPDTNTPPTPTTPKPNASHIRTMAEDMKKQAESAEPVYTSTQSAILGEGKK